MQLRWIEQLLQEFIIPQRWECTDGRFLWEAMERGGFVTWTSSQRAHKHVYFPLFEADKIWDSAIVEANHKKAPIPPAPLSPQLSDLPLRSERTEAVEMQGGILGNDRIVGNTVGVSLTLEPRSPQTSSNKSTKNISTCTHLCVKWNMQTKQ